MAARSHTPRHALKHALTHTLTFGLGTALLAACTVGPDYQAPKPQTPAAYNDVLRTTGQIPPASSVTMQSEPDPRWWRTFGDAQLDSLIDRAIAGNLSLQQAVLRIAAAREQVRAAGGAGLPTLDASGSAKRQQLGLQGLLDSNGLNSSSPIGSQLGPLTDPVNVYQINTDASWEIDLFGKVRRSVEAANANTQESIESRNDALISLEAEVARVYLQLRGAQANQQLLEAQIATANSTLMLTRNRREGGLAPQSDVENAAAQLSNLRSQQPQYAAQIRQAQNALAVLLGQAPGAIDAELEGIKPLPVMAQQIPVGLPSELARRRPDVRQAEASLHSATANIGASIAQLFPSISLTGQFGFRNTDSSYLTHWASHFYSFGPSVSLPIFEGGRLVSNVKIARAQQAEAVLNYRQTVLQALQDVEDALVAYRTDWQRTGALEETVVSQRNAYELAEDSYRKGLTSFLTALDAETRLTQAEQQLMQSRIQVATDLVKLYKALGGGWETEPLGQSKDFKVFGPAVSADPADPTDPVHSADSAAQTGQGASR